LKTERLKGAVVSALLITSLIVPLLISAGTARGQNIGWIRQFGSSATDYAYCVAVDSSGNVYVAGKTDGVLPGQTSSYESDAFVRKYDGSGNEIWTKQFGPGSSDRANGVAVDRSGNIYIAGTTFAALPGQTYLGGDGDDFVRKYDGSGNEIWTRQFGSSDYDGAYGVAVDGSGSVYVAGETGGALPGQTKSSDWFVMDVFLRKYDGSGNEIWTRQFGSREGRGSASVAVDSSGNAYVAGSGALLGQSSSGPYDAFVRKYDGSGNEVWTRQFGSSAEDSAGGIAVDGSGSVYVAGCTVGVLPGQISSGGPDAFVRKYDSSGNEIWTRQFGADGPDVANGVAVDGSGNVYVAGAISIVFPGQNFFTSNGFLRKYDGSGNEIWTRQFEKEGDSEAYGVTVDVSGNAYIAGMTWGALLGQTNLGDGDAYLIKFVEAAPGEGTAAPSGGSNWPLIAGIVVAVVVIGIAAGVYIRRR